MSSNEQPKVVTILEKINLLFRVFEKEGIDKISAIEKSLLLEQIDNLRKEVAELGAQPLIAEQKVAVELNEVPVEKEEPVLESTDSVVEEEVVEISKPELEEATETPEPEVVEVSESKPTEVSENKLSVEKVQVETTVQTKVNYQIKPLRNMKEIIDLNMSFVFKSDLFKGNHDIYNEFVSAMNEQNTEEDAFALVEQYAQKLNWDKEEKVYALLLRAVEKRFLPILGI
jgi:hypothetical protein